MANRFSVNPLGGFNVGGALASLGDTFKENRLMGQQEEKQAQLEQLRQRAFSGDPQAIQQLAALDPNAAMQFQQGAQGREEQQYNALQKRTAEYIAKASALPEEERQAYFESGIDNPNLDIDEDDRAYFSDPNLAKAVVGQVLGQDYAESVYGKREDIKKGTYNPRDYTSESWAAFEQTGDPKTLKRYQSPMAVAQKEANDLKREEMKLNQQRKQMELAQKKKDTVKVKELESAEAQNAVNNIDKLINSDLDLIFGVEEQFYPDMLRSQQGQNLKTRLKNVASTLKLMSAGKLKGQGTITDAERTMLAEAATTLTNEAISAEDAKSELMRIKPMFESVINGNSESASPKNISQSDYEALPVGSTYTYDGVEYVKGQ